MSLLDRMKGYRMSVYVCERCAPILANGDMSGFDYVELTDSETAEILDNIERVGNIAPTDDKSDGYANCAVCSDIGIDLTVWVSVE